jgi:hypothetical protein
MGLDTGVQTMSPAPLSEFTRRELEYWGDVINASRITVE